MKKLFCCILLIVLLSSLLAGCCLSHEWMEATCTAPRTCTKCGEIEGEKLNHVWVEATCTVPKTCSDCGETEGVPLEHSWKDSTCTRPKTCSNCNLTEGEARGHNSGEWEVIYKPENGLPGAKRIACTVCDEVLEMQEIYYPYFDMSFEEFVALHNEEYRSNNWEIREVDTGFSYFMNNKLAAIIFHDDMNGQKRGSATAYSRKQLEEFNELKVRYIVDNTAVIDVDTMVMTLMLGSAITYPITDYEVETFLDDFMDNWTVTVSKDDHMEGESILNGHKYTLRATVVDDFSTRVFYEFICQAELDLNS